ncbi:MAG: DEAD/DEAH box helicase family protein [Saprospiraceae bacterium]|nr:DEAD/DEAH box helicase family protein [Saprospiraceae bacterium]
MSENPDQVLREIKNRLQLRQPLAESLELLHTLLDSGALPLRKLDPAEAPVALRASAEQLRRHCPDLFRDFERGFPSITCSIATGVGKTRLMAAVILYLYRLHGVRNFFILAPNLTIYNKLIRDFGDPGYEKYVFRGVSDFVAHRPVVVTGDNYAQQSALFREQEVRINVFNIAKFNADNKVSKKDGRVQQPRLKRMSEYLGQSYWEYLSALPDLVILMDEAHRYHADASRRALDELRPVLGLELTATPFDSNGGAFRNVVYEYSLARALQDGKYVKIPAVATRKDFNFKNVSEGDTERLKLDDAISVHEDTRQAIALYARERGLPVVKPFVLIACSSIEHARQTLEYVTSDAFFEGKYAGKVIQVDSSTKDDSDIEKLLTVERPDNPVEIVIHVGMLKEGWDVNNLYTIVPLRAANSLVLIEQTLGRGLRLPYGGERTGVEKVDMVTVIAHDNFEKVVTAAKDPNSIFQKVKQIDLGQADIGHPVEIIDSPSVVNTRLATERQVVAAIQDEKERQRRTNALDAKSLLVNILPSLGKHVEVKKYDDLLKPSVQQEVIRTLEHEVSRGQLSMFAGAIVEEAKTSYAAIVRELQSNSIAVPRFVVMPAPAETWFDHFDLDTTDFNFSKLELELIRITIDQGRKMDTIEVRRNDNLPAPESILMAEVRGYPEIDHGEWSELLYKLALQAVAAINNSLAGTDKDLRETVFDHRERLGAKIYEQMMAHFHLQETGLESSEVVPFTRVEPWSFSMFKDFGKKHFAENIRPVEAIKKYVYYGFAKSCHPEYKFDSKAEKDFAIILEDDQDSVLQWMRPAKQQFRIYWNRHGDQYQPDFVVETKDTIYIVETKSASELGSDEVEDKARAALKYCTEATLYQQENGGKPWRYLLIPHTDVIPVQRSFPYYVKTYLKTNA